MNYLLSMTSYIILHDVILHQTLTPGLTRFRYMGYEVYFVILLSLRFTIF